VLELLAEHRALVETQVQLHLGVSIDAARSRLRGLVGRGLVGSQRIFEGFPATVWIERRGLAAIESTLPPPRVELAAYRHDIGVGWLWLAAHDGAFGPAADVWSERHMRSHDRRADRDAGRFGVGAGVLGPAGGEQLHYPDLLVDLRDGRRVAIELELSGKGRGRLERIMLGYAAADRVDAVLYLVPTGPLGRRIEDAARRAGVGDAVHVQLLAPGSPAGAPDPGVRLQAARGAARLLGAAGSHRGVER
jgi:hypothetical protein